MNRIVVIGSCNMDIVVLADKRPAAGEQLWATNCTSLTAAKVQTKRLLPLA